MTVYLKTGVNQLTQAVANFHPEKSSYSSEVFKKLLLEDYKFPPNVIVIGDLDLMGSLITSLPLGLVVHGNLYLAGCSITSLPVGLVVHGNLYLAGCPITSLPVGLVVYGSLYLAGCPITSLPVELVVHGDLNLNYTAITSLPVGLVVYGSLDLSYSNITSLPEGLEVRGSLDLSYSDITSLPEQLVVGHDIDLSYSDITSLPNWITTLGPRSDGNMRQINLTGTRLSEDIISRLRAAPAPGIQFHFSWAAAVPTLTFPNLAEALTFWITAANDPTLIKPDISIGDDNLGDVLEFLSRLISTAEYKNLTARPLLAKRIIEAFSLMTKDDEIKQRILDLIYEGLGSCDDRIISASEQIELAVLLHQIEHSSHTEKELKQLGKSFLLLEMVNKKAKEHIGTLGWVDEIEVYLAFQIGLADRLKLPIKTRNMIFRTLAHVTDIQIAAAGTNVETECTDAKLNAFLETWSPWMKHQRSLLVPAYEKLEVTDRKLKNDETCLIGGVLTQQPVLYNNTVYEYAAFVKWYIDDGTDPTNREKIDLKQLRRIIIPPL